MSVRYLITADPDADPETLAAGLRDAGAETVAVPAPELPDVFVATVDESVADYPERARSVPGVRVAEPDAWVGYDSGDAPARDVDALPDVEPWPEPPAADVP